MVSRHHDANEFRREGNRFHSEKALRIACARSWSMAVLAIRLKGNAYTTFISTSKSKTLFSSDFMQAQPLECHQRSKGRRRNDEGDVEVDEKVGVDGSCEKKDGSKRTTHERCESGHCVNSKVERKRDSIASPHDGCQLFVGKLIHVHIRNGI